MPDEQDKQGDQAFASAADQHDDLAQRRATAAETAAPFSGLTASVGLKEIAGSTVPGTDRLHVHGPQQSAADPVAAGLDVGQRPLSSQEDRVVTRTGTLGSGARPANAAQEGPEHQPMSDGSTAPAAAEPEVPEPLKAADPAPPDKPHED